MSEKYEFFHIGSRYSIVGADIETLSKLIFYNPYESLSNLCSTS